MSRVQIGVFLVVVACHCVCAAQSNPLPPDFGRYKPDAGNGKIPYEKRADRYEGHVTTEISASSRVTVDVRSLLRGARARPKVGGRWYIEWPRLANGRLWLCARSMNSGTGFYRMDALVPATQGRFAWDLGTLEESGVAWSTMQLCAIALPDAVEKLSDRTMMASLRNQLVKHKVRVYVPVTMSDSKGANRSQTRFDMVAELSQPVVLDEVKAKRWTGTQWRRVGISHDQRSHELTLKIELDRPPTVTTCLRILMTFKKAEEEDVNMYVLIPVAASESTK